MCWPLDAVTAGIGENQSLSLVGLGMPLIFLTAFFGDHCCLIGRKPPSRVFEVVS